MRLAKRSLHPERSAAWKKFQQQIVEKEGFRDRVERYGVQQQRLMLEAAERQQIPYSLIKLPSTPDIRNAGSVRVPKKLRNTIRRRCADECYACGKYSPGKSEIFLKTL